MPFRLLFTDQAFADLAALKDNKHLLKRYKAVCKSLGYLETNPRHPSLNTHKYHGITGENGEEVFEAYAENKTPRAYRVFWHYGPEENSITILTMLPHP